jgi:hypothetical protein
MCFDDPSGPMSLTAKEDGPRDMVPLSVLGNERERTSGTSENALPGHAPDPETRMGSTSLLHTAADSRDLFRAVSEPPGRGQRRGERCGDAGVRQAHDACSREVASTRVRCRRARLGRAAEAQVETAALPRQRQLRRAARPQLTAPSDRLQASSRFGRDPSYYVPNNQAGGRPVRPVDAVAAAECMEGDSRAVTAALHGCRSEVGVAPAPPRARCSSDAVADWRPSRRSLCRGCSSSSSERCRALRCALVRR